MIIQSLGVMPASLDPFDDWSTNVYTWVVTLSKFANDALTNPAAILGNPEWAQILYEEVWPLGRVFAASIALGVIAACIFLWRRGTEYVPQALVGVLVTGFLGPVLWRTSDEIQALSAEGNVQFSKLGSDSVPPLTGDATPLPNMGEGFIPFLGHVGELTVSFMIAACIFLLVYGAPLTKALLILSFGLLGLGDTGKRLVRLAGYAWLTCYVVGMWLLGLFRRLAQLTAALPGADQFFKWLASCFFLYVGYRIVKAMIMAGKDMLSHLTGGHNKSKVKGDVSSDITNKPDVDVADVHDPLVTSLQRTDVKSEPPLIEAEERSREEKLAGAVQYGALVLGHPEVAAAAGQVKENPGSVGPITETPSKTSSRIPAELNATLKA